MNVSIYSMIEAHGGVDSMTENTTTSVLGITTLQMGDLLISFDMDAIKTEGYLLTTPMIVCNTDDYREVKPLLNGGKISAGTALIEVKG